jgi:hypothetical protein
MGDDPASPPEQAGSRTANARSTDRSACNSSPLYLLLYLHLVVPQPLWWPSCQPPTAPCSCCSLEPLQLSANPLTTSLYRVMSQRVSNEHVDTKAALLEHLPLPCLFVSCGRTVVFANAAARRLIPSQTQTADTAYSLREGTSILHNGLLASLALPDASCLEQHLQKLEAEQAVKGGGSPRLPSSITFPAASRDSPAHGQTWTLACCEVQDKCIFSLAAALAVTNPIVPAVTKQLSTEEEDWAMLTAM